jgi:translation initiation factor IF-3
MRAQELGAGSPGGGRDGAAFASPPYEETPARRFALQKVRPNRRDQTAPGDSSDLRVNDRIRVPRVLVIDEAGTKIGEFMTKDAIQLARERGLDLVEVAPNARPPVCRIADHGKMKYEKQKKDAAARKRQHQVQIKEIKVRPKTDDHDMDVKIKHAQRFLLEGNKVKITVRFRGREHAHHEIGASQCNVIAEACKAMGIVEMTPRMDGRQMTMIIAPTNIPKPPPEDSDETAASPIA